MVDTVLRLQASAGNRATQDMLRTASDARQRASAARRSLPDVRLSPLPGAVGQGAARLAAKTTMQRRVNLGRVGFRRLPPGRLSVINLWGVNRQAERLVGQIRRVGPLSEEITRDADFLVNAAERAGGRDLEVIRGVRGRLQQRQRTDASLRDAMEGYTRSNQELTPLMTALSARMSGVRRATHGLNVAVLRQRERSAQSDVDQAEQSVADVQAEISAAQEFVSPIVDTTADLLQGNWIAGATGVLKFLGKRALNAGIDAAYSSELAAANRELRQARGRLTRIQDERHAERVRGAAEALDEANTEALAARQRLETKAQEMERAEGRLVDVLDQRGMSSAGDALFARSNTIEVSATLTRNLGRYRRLLRSMDGVSSNLQQNYSLISEFLATPGGAQQVPDQELRQTVDNLCQLNLASAEAVRTWVVEQQPSIEELSTFIDEESYREDYDRMVEEMHGMLT